jgi:predicted NBD/HSP70 family sugar kinase
MQLLSLAWGAKVSSPETVVTVGEMSIEQHDALFVLTELVRTGKAVTRSDLGRLSGLGRSIVSQRVDEAIALGLLEDADFGVSTGGRVPRNLRFKYEIGTFVVAVFGARNFGVAITDLAGKVLASHHENWDISVGPEKSLGRIIEVAKKIQADNKFEQVWASIVGVPGPVEFETGKPVAPPIMPGWNAFDIPDYMTKAFGAPCWVDNDVNLMALGEEAVLRSENLYGNAVDNLLFIKVGSGIGAGVISSGNVHRGANGSAGDIGHVGVADESKIVCRCGQIGCLEAVAGGWALARDGEAAAKAGKSDFLAERLGKKGYLAPVDISEGANSADAFCVEAIARSGRIVGETLATLVNFFNPGIVVVGGTIAATGDLFLAAVRQTVYRRSLPLATRDLRIIAANPNHEEGLIGGAALAQTQIFNRSHMNKWVTESTPRALV